MPRQIMLSFFDVSTAMARPWAEAGYLCYCIDTQHPRGETKDDANENIIRVGANIHHWLPPRDGEAVFAAFFPPCTDLAVSGARWFRDKGIGRLVDALALFKRSVDLAELLKCPYLIENPVATVSKYWRPPDHTFDPCDYGDPYTKKTCLWTGGGFVMPKKRRVEPTEGMKLYWLPPSKDRANLRSVTPAGFARAVFKANVTGRKLSADSRSRRKLVRKPDSECAVTGIRSSAILVAARIKPWHASNDDERANLANGILLAPQVHALFDRGLLGFEDDGRTILSRRLSLSDRRLLSLPTRLGRPPTKSAKQFLRYHRDNIFIRG
jgi:hypothetical protein